MYPCSRPPGALLNTPFSVPPSENTLINVEKYRSHASSVVFGIYIDHAGSGGRAIERRTVNRGNDGLIPPTAVSKLR